MLLNEKWNTSIRIVSPVYLAEEIIDELIKRIRKQVLKITENYEIILVEDGSSDNSWQKIEENCKKYKKVKGVRLSRNFSGNIMPLLQGYTSLRVIMLWLSIVTYKTTPNIFMN